MKIIKHEKFIFYEILFILIAVIVVVSWQAYFLEIIQQQELFFFAAEGACVALKLILNWFVVVLSIDSIVYLAMHWNASAMFIPSFAEVSKNFTPYRSASSSPSRVDTFRWSFASIFVAIMIFLTFGSARSLIYFIQSDMFWNVFGSVTLYAKMIPIAPL